MQTITYILFLHTSFAKNLPVHLWINHRFNTQASQANKGPKCFNIRASVLAMSNNIFGIAHRAEMCL
jgi:hypothetical protein